MKKRIYTGTTFIILYYNINNNKVPIKYKLRFIVKIVCGIKSIYRYPYRYIQFQPCTCFKWKFISCYCQFKQKDENLKFIYILNILLWIKVWC